MDKWIGGIVALAVVALIAWLMYRSWRRRTARDESLSSYPLPESLGAPMLEAEVLYVATTPVGDPLERLAVRDSHSAVPHTSRWSPGAAAPGRRGVDDLHPRRQARRRIDRRAT